MLIYLKSKSAVQESSYELGRINHLGLDYRSHRYGVPHRFGQKIGLIGMACPQQHISPDLLWIT
jgi:hypothetical protein